MENMQEEFNKMHQHIDDKIGELHGHLDEINNNFNERFNDLHGHVDEVKKPQKTFIICLIILIVLNILMITGSHFV